MRVYHPPAGCESGILDPVWELMVENGVAAIVFEIPPILVFLQNLHSPRVGCIGIHKVRIAGILGFNDCVCAEFGNGSEESVSSTGHGA
jgi:hypothetical protein